MGSFNVGSFASGILVGVLLVVYGLGWFIKSEVKQSMVDRHLAHYDERSKEYVKDSIRHSENFDTIFVIKRSAK